MGQKNCEKLTNFREHDLKAMMCVVYILGTKASPPRGEPAHQRAAHGAERRSVGGQRRVIVPPSALSATQAACLAPDESIRIDLEMLAVANGPLSYVASIVPPGERAAILRGACALASVTYLWTNFAGDIGGA